MRRSGAVLAVSLLVTYCRADLLSNRILPTVPILVNGGLTFATLSAGDRHTCALTRDGTVYCWGLNDHGTIGDGSPNNATVPALVSAGFSGIQAGGGFNCGLKRPGLALCWGNNASGQLGTGQLSSGSVIPVAVSGDLIFTAISPGSNHACGLSADVAYCWGLNDYGQLGTAASLSYVLVPTAITSALTFSAISSGNDYTCGITTTGFAYCWGWNRQGKLGGGLTEDSSAAPVRVLGLAGVLGISAGVNHACAVTSNGSAYCWGDNAAGQLGDDRAESSSASPVAVAGGVRFATISAGQGHTCGATADGNGYCWGDNTYDQLGNATSGGSAGAPTSVAGGLRFAVISAGGNHTCGLTVTGVAYCWGAVFCGTGPPTTILCEFI